MGLVAIGGSDVLRAWNGGLKGFCYYFTSDLAEAITLAICEVCGIADNNKFSLSGLETPS